ncbi:TNF receptor-associated factor 4-like [Ornithodoros turicata]|uniref:TNF receptor-associated factor 4-like n=1 Tax=Ornithodoros turicata TaxID=34597 RepID=UPI00313A3243
MLASSFSQQQPSLDSLSMCEYCGAASIDLWKGTTCEHYVCKKCLLNKEPSQAPRCTCCNGNSTLLCPGSIFGCKYQTAIPHNCLDHFRTCPRRPTPCPNECSSIVPNTDLPKHLTDECSKRTQECRFCYGNYFVSEIGNHLKDCQDYPLSCQYCNQENIRRGSFEEHGFGCRKTPKLCKMAAFDVHSRQAMTKWNVI